MLTLVIAVSLAIVVCSFCSISEAVLYSVPWSVIERLRKEGKKSGQILMDLRTNVEKPITAILTLNTVATAAGASVAGAAAVSVYGAEALGIFSAIFTVALLLVGEIFPKTLGVVYYRQLAGPLARPMRAMVLILSPIILICGFLVKVVQPKKKGPLTTEDDIRAVVSLTRKAGLIKPYEELSIRNILSLDQKSVSDIMTPRTVVFSLPAQLNVAQAKQAKTVWPHSRIPVYDHEDPEDIVGIVYRRQLFEALANDQDEVKLGELMKPVQFVLESLSLDRLLVKFLESRMHLFVVLDEYGGLSGVVSLEDVLEEILGKEIIDETDQVADMRELARQQRDMLRRGNA